MILGRYPRELISQNSYEVQKDQRDISSVLVGFAALLERIRFLQVSSSSWITLWTCPDVSSDFRDTPTTLLDELSNF